MIRNRFLRPRYFLNIICPYIETFDIRSLRRTDMTQREISERLIELAHCYAFLIVYNAILSSESTREIR